MCYKETDVAVFYLKLPRELDLMKISYEKQQ